MIHLVAVSLYIGSFGLWLRALFAGAPGRGAGWAARVAGAAVAVHAAALARFTAIHGELPLVGLAPSLSTLALLVGLGLVGTMLLGEGGRVGILLVPLVVFLEGTALVLGIEPAPGPQAFQGAWFSLHVALALAGYGGMAVASAAGTLYLVQFHELRAKRLGRVFRFIPPLDTLDRLGRAGVAFGLVTLALAIALGWAWTVRFGYGLAGEAWKVAWAVGSWLALLGALVARRGRGGVGRRGALAAVVGFWVVVASFVVLRLAAGGGGFFL